MQLNIYFFVTLITLSLYACQSKPEETLLGKWEINKEIMKKDLEKESTEIVRENQAKAMEESIEALMEKIQINYEFRADGSVKMLSQGKETKGKWIIAEDKKLITTDTNNQKTEAEIVELSKNNLALKIGSETYFFKKAE